MHRRAICCGICGRKFFPASLPFHLKACQERHSLTLDQLLASMPKKGKSRRRQFSQQNNRPININRGGGLPKLETSTTEPSPLQKCQFCGRSFSLLRIQKHTKICSSVKKRPVFRSDHQRSIDSRMGSRASSRICIRSSSASSTAGLSRSADFSKNYRISMSQGGATRNSISGFRKSKTPKSRPASTSPLQSLPRRSSNRKKIRPLTVGNDQCMKDSRKITWGRPKDGFRGRDTAGSVKFNFPSFGRNNLSRTAPSSRVGFSRGWTGSHVPSRFGGSRSSALVESKGGFDPSNRTSADNPLCTNAWQAAPH